MSNGPLAMFQGALETDPDLKIGWAVSEMAEGDPNPHERVELLPVLAPTNKSRLIGMLSMGGVLSVADDYDAVLTNQVAMTSVYRRMLDKPMVNLQMWTATPRARKVLPGLYAGETDIWQETISPVLAPNLWESTMQYDETIKLLRGHVDTTWVEEHSKVLPLGVLTNQLDEVYQQRMARDRPGMFWGAQWMSMKGYEKTARVMAKTHAATGCEILMSTPSTDVQPVFDVPLVQGQDRSQFYRHMAMGDVFVCNSIWESYGIAWLEMLASGMLGVYGPSWWIEYVLPDWYPFVADSVKEQTEMAIMLIKDWPDGPLWRKYGERTREWVREEHGMHRAGATLLEGLHEWV